ncbi:MAG: D-aminoacyl-tRNA deacylase [Bacteroidota bacterium]
MRAVIQRVLEAGVSIDGEVKASIGNGLLVLVGIENADTKQDVDWLSAKIVNLRIFNDNDGVPNICIKETGGGILIISQFTLHAVTKKGNRPSYIKASKPAVAIPLYEAFIQQVETDLGRKVGTGEFGADMKVNLINDGPVTIIIDTKNKDF